MQILILRLALKVHVGGDSRRNAAADDEIDGIVEPTDEFEYWSSKASQRGSGSRRAAVFRTFLSRWQHDGAH